MNGKRIVGGSQSRTTHVADHDVAGFAQRHGLSEQQLRALMKRHGDNRAVLAQWAARLKQAGDRPDGAGSIAGPPSC